MKKLFPFILVIFGTLPGLLTACSDDEEKTEAGVEDINEALKNNPYFSMQNDLNLTWGTSLENVLSSPNNGYNIVQKSESIVVFSKEVERGVDVYLSYKFDKDKKLCAATITFPENKKTKRASDGIYSMFDGEEHLEEGMEVKKTEDGKILSIDKTTALNGDVMISIGYSYYVPLEKRDDCVNLGLSVQWAATNLGAKSPTDVGSFYSWSETSTKSEFWISNYAYSNNNANKYVYVYNNPRTNICGTQYDAATKKLGEGWKMPSLAEVNELINQCTWEKDEVDGKAVFKVTGPNGNSIILPVIAYNYQNKGYKYYSGLYLATGECISKASEDCYVITTQRSGNKYIGTIVQEWKCWGYNIRPVYTK